ncbi:Hsp70 family protein [Hahella sp. HN01]|uniref:Hsp70 family protein n=1 Tax=Hahella sp. HN01 TaxID=2847262 RepID=UPI001C1EE20A|nr:hsp70 family protein [Hahella sp. HN01]
MKYLVGIDLGTTHTVVAYTDISTGAENAVPKLFEIEQLVAPGELAKKPMLPSFRYHPAPGEIAEHHLQLPWRPQALPGEIDQVVIGEWARELGSKVDGRLVSSAKSWLSHPQVERTADILPWAAAEDVVKVSPLLASASYLHHVRQAWNREHPQDLLEQQEVVITVPASFDEGARSLTLEAARLAGLPEVLLLEEPQAVVYDWCARNKEQAQSLLQDARLLLVCDVGGGTTDLSLISVAAGSGDQGELTLNRVGVGDHLMLGGDNIDLALAHIAEQRIASARKLSAAALSQLIQQTRKAKELLLSPEAPDAASVTVLGGGAKLIGGAKSCELTREEAHHIAVDGFFPLCEFSERPARRRSAVVEFGLPYAPDPAVSKYIAEFLARHEQACRQALKTSETAAAVPDVLLLNGGVFNSPLLSERAQALLSQWNGAPVKLLDNAHPNLAVAFGGVAYGLARKGAQIKIGGGSARSYFLIVEASTDAAADKKFGVCLLPKATEEGEEIRLHGRKFALRIGRPVRFHLASSTGDRTFSAGDLQEMNDDDFIFLPPMVSALSADAEDSGAEVEVELSAVLTEAGALQVECVGIAGGDASPQRWRLDFQLRKQTPVEDSSAQLPAKFAEAAGKIEAAYSSNKKGGDSIKTLRNDLEKLLGKRDQWDMPTLRAVFDKFLEGSKNRRRSAAHERIWLNFAGYCLRPGFGDPLDDWRVQQVWKIYQQGLQFDKEGQLWSEWWTFWRRVAGGLNSEQQQRVYKDAAVYINPAALRSRKLVATPAFKSYEDMVRLAAALERLPVETKVEVAKWLLQRLQKPSEPVASWWALGRIASRQPFHGSAHNVVTAETVSGWLPQLLKQDWKKNQEAAFATVMLSRMSGDRVRDLSEADRKAVAAALKTAKAPAVWVDMVSQVVELDEAETKRVFGEALPSGLKLLAE